MKTDIIKVHTSGYVHCKSAFYSAQDSISENKEYTFYPGVNKLVGDSALTKPSPPPTTTPSSANCYWHPKPPALCHYMLRQGWTKL